VTTEKDVPERFSLGRWSRRKLEAAAQPGPAPLSPAAPLVPSPGTTAATPVELPPIDSLHFDSDFTAFLRPEVDEKVKRAALKQLFRDPRFNVMDGLDTYVDDYTKPDPIPPDMLRELLQRFDLRDAPPAPSAEGHPAQESAGRAGDAGAASSSSVARAADEPRDRNNGLETHSDVTSADALVPSASAERKSATSPPITTSEPVPVDPKAARDERQ
jgi:Protein of unknown function (DUF3306)